MIRADVPNFEGVPVPPRGQMKPLPTSLLPARRELAPAVRALLRETGGSLRGVAGQINSSRSVLSRLASGQSLTPDEDIILKLHELAERKGRAKTMAKSELQHLLLRVRDEPATAAARPAADTVARMHVGAPAAPAVGTGAPFVAPVPTAERDRRNGPTAVKPPWPVDELMLHLTNGRYEHAIGMLDYAGDEAPAVESAAAIQACRNRGLTEATETLLRKVGSRPGDVVLEVIGHLIDADHVTDARALTPVPRSARTA
jgi:hypothetical protein